MRIRSKSVNHLKFKFELKHTRKTSVSVERNSGGRGEFFLVEFCSKSRAKNKHNFLNHILFIFL